MWVGFLSYCPSLSSLQQMILPHPASISSSAEGVEEHLGGGIPESISVTLHVRAAVLAPERVSLWRWAAFLRALGMSCQAWAMWVEASAALSPC